MLSIETITLISYVLLGLGVLIAFGSVVFDLDLDFLPTLTLGSLFISSSASFIVTSSITNNLIISLLVTIIITTVITGLIHFYIVPMKKVEATTGYSVNDLLGATGEIVLKIPENGIGEALIKTGISLTSKPAISMDGKEIESGEKVVVMEIKENVLYVEKVSEFEKK